MTSKEELEGRIDGLEKRIEKIEKILKNSPLPTRNDKDVEPGPEKPVSPDPSDTFKY